MKSLALVFILLAPAAFAAGPPLANFCQPFVPNDCEVRWEAATNSLLTTARVFKVVPAKFSSASLSNLLALAGLTSKDKKQSPRTGVFVDKNVLCFADKQESRHLSLVPSQGYIVLNKETVIATPNNKAPQVPSPKEAARLTLELLAKLEFQNFEIATNSHGEPLLTSIVEQSDIYREKATGDIATNVVSCGVTLTRQIDGIPIWGSAGVSANFGDQNQLAYLTITWRSIQPFKISPVPDAASLIHQIKSGKTLIRDEHSGSFKAITIKRVKLYYWESEGSQRQEMIYPFAVMDATTDTPGDKAKIQLFVPFASE